MTAQATAQAVDAIYEQFVAPGFRDELLMLAGDYQPHIRDRITAMYHEIAVELAVLADAILLADDPLRQIVLDRHFA